MTPPPAKQQPPQNGRTPWPRSASTAAPRPPAFRYCCHSPPYPTSYTAALRALTEENLRLHFQSRRSQHPREQPSSGRRNPAPSYAAAAIPMLPDPTPLRSIGIGARTRPSRRGIYRLQVGLDWTPDSGSLCRIGDLGLGLDSGRGPRRGRGESTTVAVQSNPLLDFFDFFLPRLSPPLFSSFLSLRERYTSRLN